MPDQLYDQCFIIKRFFPHAHKLALISYQHGRINVQFEHKSNGQRIWPGMHIKGIITRSSHFWKIENITITQLPCFQNYYHVLWLHNILELCYYFVPLEHLATDIYFFLHTCFNMADHSKMLNQEDHYAMKHSCLAKFLALIGDIDVEYVTDFITFFNDFSCGNIDFIKPEKITYSHQRLQRLKKKNIDAWIINNLKQHPMFHAFKTIQMTPS